MVGLVGIEPTYLRSKRSICSSRFQASCKYMMQTSIIKKLSQSDLDPLKRELESASHLWSKHDYGKEFQRPLRHGKSLLIHNLNMDRELVGDNRALFPNTIKVVSEWCDRSKENLGRSYWHTLGEEERIDTHVDKGRYFLAVDRFQVYLDVPSEANVTLDGKLWNYHEDTRLANSLVHFNMSELHFYFNASKKPLTFLVMDFFKLQS